MKLSSYQFPGACDFELVPLYLENLCTLVLIFHLHVILKFDAITSDLLTTSLIYPQIVAACILCSFLVLIALKKCVGFVYDRCHCIKQY